MSDLFDYKKEMSELRFTENQKKALAEAAASAAQGQTAKRRRPVFRAALIAAVMVAVLAVGAGAAGVLPSPTEIFAPLFGGAAAQTEVIDKIGHPIGASDTVDGITISADAIMGTEYNAVIVYTIRRDDGERFFPKGEDLDSSMLVLGGFGGLGGIKGGSHGSAWFVDEDPEDDRVQYIEAVNMDYPVTKATVNVTFYDLCYWKDGQAERQPLYAGRWYLHYEVDYEDCSVALGGGETFSQDGLNFTIDEVSVSPIGFRVAYTADRELVWSGAPSGRQDPEDARESQRYLENVEILLTKTDGTVLDLSNSGGSITPKDGVSVCDKGDVFDEIIPLEDMASLSVGGVTYEIPHS